MAHEEKDVTKQSKLLGLKLTKEEGTRADSFIQLLAVCIYRFFVPVLTAL